MEDSKPTYTVNDENEYAVLLEKVDGLMKKGEANTTLEEQKHIRAIGEALMAYDKRMYPIPEPHTLVGILELRMYEMRTKHQDLAQTLGISQEELEMILWEDKKADTSLLNVIKEELDISSEVISNYIEKL